MSRRRWAHLLIACAWIVLQGMAPLLHAHPGGERVPARGVHLPVALPAAAAGTDEAHFTRHDITPSESTAIGLGSELRRDHKGSGDDAAAPAQLTADALPRAPRAVTVPPRPAAVRHAPSLRLPPSHAPPASPA